VAKRLPFGSYRVIVGRDGFATFTGTIDDFETGRVDPSLTFDVSAGVILFNRSTRSARLQVDVRNLTDRLNVINFAGLFSGTALAMPRSASVRLRVDF
jgi:hypothetical protein